MKLKLYFCIVNIKSRHIVSLFLACIMYASSLLATPPVLHITALDTNQSAIHTADASKVSGFIKNELSTTTSNYSQNSDNKNTGFNLLQIYYTEAQSHKPTLIVTDREVSLFNSALPQLSRKLLIFPFHTYW